MLPGTRLQQNIREQHTAAGPAATGDSSTTAERPGPKKTPQDATQPPKLNPPRKQLAAFAALKEAVQEANKSVKAARAAGMPDASRAPRSATLQHKHN
jgi:hypothetical protein